MDGDASDEPRDDAAGDEPTPIGEAIFGFIREVLNDLDPSDDAAGGERAAGDPGPTLEDAFEAGRDALAAALGSIGHTLEELSEAAADAATNASEQFSGLAAAIAGSGSVKDALDRVVAQIGEPDDESPDWWRQLFGAIQETLAGERPDGDADGAVDEPPLPDDFEVPDYPPLDDD